MSATSAWVKGANIQLTLYNLSNGAISDSFANNTAIQAEGLNANGAAFFEWDGKHFMTYATADSECANGYKFALAVNGNDAGIAGMSCLWQFPAQGIGDVYSQTWSAPCVAHVKADGSGVDLYYYVPGCGIASYTLAILFVKMYPGRPDLWAMGTEFPDKLWKQRHSHQPQRHVESQQRTELLPNSQLQRGHHS